MSDIKIVCPVRKQPLISTSEKYISANKEDYVEYPIVKGIPRFVESESYASAFGYQWKVFQKTQLDSYTNTNYSIDRLKRIFGSRLESLKNKNVLEVGCGAGRFTEILLNYGAKVYSTDLSSAVEANKLNFQNKHQYFLAQANLFALPFEYEVFDYVICLGVLQHTPDSERSISELVKYVKPGGMILIDHYKRESNSPNKKVRFEYLKSLLNTNYQLRKILISRSPKQTIQITKVITNIFWPLHVIANYFRDKGILSFFSNLIFRISPLFDYHETFAALKPAIMKEWMWLDLHDSVTDYYKSLKSTSEIREFLISQKLNNIDVWEGGNGIEARATKAII